MDINVIEKLMAAMEHSNLTKLEIEEAGFRICMEKENFSQKEQHWKVERNIEKNIEKNLESEACYRYITSPMVGTFYLSAQANKEPYVKVGEQVKQGQTVCILESMKLMNEIEASMDGTIKEILVSDGEMVEYGQKLFEILQS